MARARSFDGERAGADRCRASTLTSAQLTQEKSLLAQQVNQYLNHLSVERGLSANTLAAYRRDLARYVEFCVGNGVTGPRALIIAS